MKVLKNERTDEFEIHIPSAELIEALTLLEKRRIQGSLFERKLGQWIKNPPTEAWEYHCSLCGTQEDYKENYCPNCGAKMMDEVEE